MPHKSNFFFHFCQVLHLSPSLTKENKDFKILTIWGPGATQRGPKSEIFWTWWFSYLKRNILCKYEVSKIENKIFKILTIWGPGAAQRGPKSEIFWAWWFSYLKLNILCKYEVSTIENKIFKILTILGDPLGKIGALNQNSASNIFFALG